VIECGGGSGLLASDILDSIERGNPELYETMQYRIVEKGVRAADVLEETLRKHLAKVRFKSSLSEIETEGAGGVILSNELVDAFPFHRVRFSDGAVKEIFVTLSGGEFVEIPDEPSSIELARYFNGYETFFREGQEAEVNLNAGRWLGEAEKALGKGFILTIDYGFLAPELYNPERMKGTYKCMHKHSISDNPYVNIGEQDITAHVDFSGLIRVGESLGLDNIKYTTQGQFLIDWGVLDIMTRLSERDGLSDKEDPGANRAIKNLFLPGSMGNSFKALLQAKNMGTRDEGFYPESPLKLSFGVI
jgi:SAM-dependent MidA family methyltransferase